MQRKIQKIIKDLSEKHNLPEDVIRAICDSQVHCAREAAKKGEDGKPETFLNIRFKHIGLLVAKPGKILALHRANERRLSLKEDNKDRGGLLIGKRSGDKDNQNTDKTN